MGATLGATGTNNFPILWTCPDSRWGTSPRSRTDLNGPGLQYGHLRIRKVEIARDMHGMILASVVGEVAKSPGSDTPKRGVTDVLENH
jgi:hypothetical protein